MRIFILSLLIVFIFGCDSDNSSSDDTLPDYNELYTQPIGEWKTGCLPSEDNESWNIRSFLFTDDTVKSEWFHFQDKNCEVPLTDIDYWSSLAGFEGSYQFIKHIDSSNGLKANLYELSITFRGEPLTYELALLFEFEKFSTGYTDNGEYYFSYSPTFYLEN